MLAISEQLAHELAGDALGAGLPVDVVELVGIGLQVVELVVVDVGIVGDISRLCHPLIAIVLACACLLLVLVLLQGTLAAMTIEVDKLIAIGANAVMLACQVPRGVVVVVVVEGLAQALLSLEQRAQRVARHLLRLLHTGIVEEGGRIVDILHHRRADGSCGNVAWIAHDEWRAQALLIHESLVEPAMFAQVEALVGGIDDDGVLSQAVFVEVAQQATYVLVDAMDDGEVVAQVCLVFPLHQRPAGEAVALEAVVAVAEVLFVGLALIGIQSTIFSNGPAEAVDRASQRVYFQVEGQFHVLVNRHLLRVGGRATCCIIVPHGLGQGELGVVVHAQILHVGEPAAMRCFVVDKQTERLRCVTMVEEVNGVVGDEVGGIAFLAEILPTRGRTLELRIPVGALVVEHMITIEALRLAHEVPLANHARLVACLLQQFGEEGARRVDALK